MSSGGIMKKKAVDRAELGNGLPQWHFTETLYEGHIDEKAGAMGLAGVYKSDVSKEDVRVYRIPKEGRTLEEYGKQESEKLLVFCNMMDVEGYPAAVLNCYDDNHEEPIYVQEYIFEDSEEFVKVCTLYKTNEHELKLSDAVFRLPAEYAESVVTEGREYISMIYEEYCEKLPTFRLTQIRKEAEGKSLEEELKETGMEHELIRGEIFRRNDIELAFMGWIEEGKLFVKAVLDMGESYIILNAEDPPKVFQHVVNAVIDSVKDK